VLLLFGLSLLLWVYITKPFQSGPNRMFHNLSVSLGPAETVLGPDQRPDNPFHTLGNEPDIAAYVARPNPNYDGAESYGFTTNDLEELKPFPTAVLVGGKSGTFDSCGAWLNSTWQDGSLVRGWYHAETDCLHRPSVRQSVAYAESYDGGRTFVKLNYPQNQVITAPQRYQNPIEASEGAPHVIRVGDYLYMYFVANRDFKVRVARSRVADGGRPGKWFKYHDGRFSEPGIGGESSPIAPGTLARSWVSYNSALNAFIGFSRVDKGYGLAISPDGLNNWKKVTGPILESEGEYWNRNPNSKELITYLSLIGSNGDDNDLSTDFWLYYVQVKPGESLWEGSYLVRRQVHIVPSTSSHPLDTAPQIALSRYRSEKSDDTWVTTTNPSPEYRFVRTLGYLFTLKATPYMRPVYDCYDAQEDDHVLDTREDCGAHGDPNVRNLRRMGWISIDSFPGSQEAFDCFDPKTSDHFASTERGCDGKQRESHIGYLARL
jgi:hypothetical protein